MLKKIAIAAVAVLAGLLVLNNTRLGSWCGFAWHKAKEAVSKQVPPEMEIERLKFELTQLEPEIKKNTSALAKEMQAVEDLHEDIAKTKIRLDKKYAEIQAAIQEVDSGAKLVSYNGRKYQSLVEAKEAILLDRETYKQAKKSLEARENLLAAKESAIVEAKKQLASWQATRQQLADEIDQLEAELKALKIAEEQNNIRIDNTRLNRFRASLDDLKHTLKVRQKELALSKGEFAPAPDLKPAKVEAVEGAWDKMKEEEKAGKIAGK